MQDNFAVISDVAKDEDPRLVRSFLSFFRSSLEDLLVNPPPRLEHWRVPIEEFDHNTLDDILRNLRHTGRVERRDWAHLMAMKIVGNVGAHINLFTRWRNRTLLQFMKDDAARSRRHFDRKHVPSLAAALRGCRALGVDVPQDARAFWARVNPAAVAEAAIDPPPGTLDDDAADDDDEPVPVQGGAAAAAGVASRVEAEARARSAHARAEEHLRTIDNLLARQAAGAMLDEDEEITVTKKAEAEGAAAEAKRVLEGLGLVC